MLEATKGQEDTFFFSESMSSRRDSETLSFRKGNFVHPLYLHPRVYPSTREEITRQLIKSYGIEGILGSRGVWSCGGRTCLSTGGPDDTLRTDFRCP